MHARSGNEAQRILGDKFAGDVSVKQGGFLRLIVKVQRAQRHRAFQRPGRLSRVYLVAEFDASQRIPQVGCAVAVGQSCLHPHLDALTRGRALVFNHRANAARQRGPVIINLVGEPDRAKRAVGLGTLTPLEPCAGLHARVGGVFEPAGIRDRFVSVWARQSMHAFGGRGEPQSVRHLISAAQTQRGFRRAAIDRVGNTVFAEHVLIGGVVGVDTEDRHVVALGCVERKRAGQRGNKLMPRIQLAMARKLIFAARRQNFFVRVTQRLFVFTEHRGLRRIRHRPRHAQARAGGGLSRRGPRRGVGQLCRCDGLVAVAHARFHLDTAVQRILGGNQHAVTSVLRHGIFRMQRFRRDRGARVEFVRGAAGRLSAPLVQLRRWVFEAQIGLAGRQPHIEFRVLVPQFDTPCITHTRQAVAVRQFADEEGPVAKFER